MKRWGRLRPAFEIMAGASGEHAKLAQQTNVVR